MTSKCGKNKVAHEQPRSQGLFPGLGAGPDPPPNQGKGPGNEVGTRGVAECVTDVLTTF